MRHLYVHVPFCQRRCSYCDFSIAVRATVPERQYVAAITRELAGTAPAERDALETIYFGGGTPSLLPAAGIALVLDAIRSHTTVAPTAEITLEANPEDVTTAAVAAWHTAGVNRISLGAQSFDDGVLRWMHRVHTAARIGAAVQTLRDAGFDNLSLDLIFALPASLQRDWTRDLESAIALEPEHLSLYGLTVEPRTPLHRWIARGATSAPSDERYADEYLVAHERLAAAGLLFYEVSNAARGQYRSRHNSAYWTGQAYAGLGPAAHSYDGRTRRWNIAAWEAYRRSIEAKGSAVESEEILSDEQRQLERLYLSMRTREGLSLAAAGIPRDTITPFVEQGWIVESDGQVKCTVEGWLRLDALVAALTEPLTTS